MTTGYVTRAPVAGGSIRSSVGAGEHCCPQLVPRRAAGRARRAQPTRGPHVLPDRQFGPRRRSAPCRTLGRAAALAATLSALALATVPRDARAQQRQGTTADVFRRFADRTLRIQVTEAGSAAKASVGTGFYVDAEGHVLTNYHVVAQLVTAPGRYRAEVAGPDGAAAPLTVAALDVVHDLALLAAPRPGPAFFQLGRAEVPRGARLYALGHPRDLGLSIVEGTYNGLLEHTLYPKIHFTGSLNPGMSGGPALDEDGAVVGVNVSTGGDGLSFLVPVAYATDLLDRARGARFRPASDLLGDVARQLRDYQAAYVAPLFAPGTPTVSLGAFTVPTTPAPFFRCWADAKRTAGQPYELVDHRCSTDDEVYVSAEQSSGVVEVRHRVLTSTRLDASQFAALHSREFEGDGEGPFGSDDEVTAFKCETRNVRLKAVEAGGHSAAPAAGERRLRVQLCVRRYRKLERLYDAVLRAAPLGTGVDAPRRGGLVTTLTMSGVTFESVQQLTRRYLERVSWHR